jgi:hypothetical protein
MQDLVKYLSALAGASGQITVGQPVREALDLTRYETQAKLVGPHGIEQALTAAPGEGDRKRSSRWWVESAATDYQGFYELHLTRRDGGEEVRLTAANVDPEEGNLRRVSREFERKLAAKGIVVEKAADVSASGQAGGSSELWRYVLVAVLAVLLAEQVWGWYLGRQRS